MSRKMPIDEAQKILNDLEDYEEKFSKWERGFFESISETIETAKFKTLSEGQTEKLEELRDKYIR